METFANYIFRCLKEVFNHNSDKLDFNARRSRNLSTVDLFEFSYLMFWYPKNYLQLTLFLSSILLFLLQVRFEPRSRLAPSST